MTDLNCTVQRLLDTQDADLTVGERFALSCQGSQVPAIDRKSLHFKLAEADQYKIQLLQVEKASDSELRLQVVSDLVGSQDLKGLILEDKDGHTVSLGEVRFTVKSVQDPQKPVQEPYGPAGPFVMSIPWIYWVGLVAVLGLVGLFVTWRVSLRLRRRKLMRQVETKASAASPDTELFQILRRFQRESKFLLNPEIRVQGEEATKATEILDEAYRMFLSRTFKMPVLYWPTAKTLRTLKREQELSEVTHEELRKILRELDRSRKVDLQSRDYQQIVEWIRDSAGRILKEHRGPA